MTIDASSLFAAVMDPVIAAARSAESLPLERDGIDHLIAHNPMTTTQALDWLFEGRMQPSSERFRPDPVQGASGDPQTRFLFRPTWNEFLEAKQSFRDRYALEGPGWSEINWRIPEWIPKPARTQILSLAGIGSFRQTQLPVVRSFEGEAPWGRVVLWFGRGEFLRQMSAEVYNYFPEDEQFYEDLFGAGSQKAHLVHYACTAFNDDMRYFVEKKRMRPEAAREEIKRIWGAIFKKVVDTMIDICSLGAGLVAANKLAGAADSTLDAVLESFRRKRHLFSIAQRRAARMIVVFRGTTLAKKSGDILVAAAQHDLGRGTYFTLDEWLAKAFQEMRGASEGGEGVLLMAKIDPEEVSTFAVMRRRGPRLAGLPGFLRLWLVGGMVGEIGRR